MPPGLLRSSGSGEAGHTCCDMSSIAVPVAICRQCDVNIASIRRQHLVWIDAFHIVVLCRSIDGSLVAQARYGGRRREELQQIECHSPRSVPSTDVCIGR
jgi:hypothetical protein